MAQRKNRKMVNNIVEENQNAPRFWSSWRGRIIRAIVLDRVYRRNEILKRTQLDEEQFEQALGELSQLGLLTGVEEERFWVNSIELCNQYRSFLEKLQGNLVDWVNQWRLQEEVESRLDHFFLEDRLLYEFSEKLLGNANIEVLVANPYIRKCHISNTLMSMGEKGINVKIITRSSPERYIKELSEKRIAVTYDDSVHAKLIVVDRRVGIVSSMNFFAASSGGASWEAGLVTTERSIVQSIAGSILDKI